MTMNKNISIVIAAGVILLAGCGTNIKKPTASNNPPPEMAFSQYTSFSLKPTHITESCDLQEGGDAALRIIESRLEARVGSMLASWNPAKAPKVDRKLVIEPVCSDAKLVSGAAHFWGRALASRSVIVMKVRYIDQSSGKVIAEPVFYQRADATEGAWTMGAADRDMLERVVDMINDYTARNYSAAVGGPTGM